MRSSMLLAAEAAATSLRYLCKLAHSFSQGCDEKLLQLPYGTFARWPTLSPRVEMRSSMLLAAEAAATSGTIPLQAGPLFSQACDEKLLRYFRTVTVVSWPTLSPRVAMRSVLLQLLLLPVRYLCKLAHFFSQGCDEKLLLKLLLLFPVRYLCKLAHSFSQGCDEKLLLLLKLLLLPIS